MGFSITVHEKEIARLQMQKCIKCYHARIAHIVKCCVKGCKCEEFINVTII